MKNILFPTFILTSALLVIRSISSFFPHQRLWGLNQAAFIDYLIFLYPVLFLAALYLYLKAGRGEDEGVNQQPMEIELHRFGFKWSLSVTLAAGVLFYFFSARAYFLGDSLTLISNMANPDYGIKYRNFGEAVIHMQLIKLFGSYTKESVENIYRWTSILSGTALVAMLLYYAPKITGSRLAQTVFVLLNLLAGVMLHFYGYVENYTLAVTMIYWMVLSGISSLRHNNKSIIPVVAFGLAVALHNLSIVYLPGLIFYLLLAFSGKTVTGYLTKRLPVIAAGCAVLFAMAYMGIKSFGPLFWQLSLLPVLKDRFTVDDYYLISPSHLIDFANLLLFLAPISIAVLFLRATRRKKSSRAVISAESSFLVIMIAFSLMAAFVIEPKLGMARDWDLMSLMLIGFVVWGIYSWVGRFSHHPHFQWSSLLLALAAASVFIPWLALHNSPGGLYAYAMAAMERDPKHSQPSLVIMSAYNRETGNMSESRRIDRLCAEALPEREFMKQGRNSFEQGDPGKAIYYLNQAREANPLWFAPYWALGECYLEFGKYDQAIRNLELADALNPYNWEVTFSMGRAYQLSGDTVQANEYYRSTIRCNKSLPEPYLLLGEYFLIMQQPDSALKYFTALPDGAFPAWIFYGRGMSYFQLGDTDRTLENLSEYLKYGRDEQLLNQVQELVDRLENGR